MGYKCNKKELALEDEHLMGKHKGQYVEGCPICHDEKSWKEKKCEYCGGELTSKSKKKVCRNLHINKGK
jgi:hypothetical protein